MMQTNSELQCYNRKGIESEKKKVYQTPLVLVLLCVYDKELPLDIYKKTCKLQTEYVNAKYLPTLFPPSLFFLAHLSTTCSGGAIVTGHRLASVRLSVRPSVRPSVNNFLKNLLLQNQKASLDKTWQECSLGEALQKLLKEFNSNKNSGCHGNKMAENGKNL